MELHHTAAGRNRLQQAATRCTMLHHAATYCMRQIESAGTTHRTAFTEFHKKNDRILGCFDGLL